MEENHVLYSVENNVATITLNRPNRGNSLTLQMVNLVIDYFQRIKEDNNVRVVVLTGTGKFFCTGMDLTSSNQAVMAEALKEGKAASNGIALFETVKSCTKPVIARINGPALGGGWGLIFCTDIRIVHPSAYFAFAEVKRGIVPAIISAYITPQLGPFATKELFITGRRITATEAFRYGFVSGLAKDDNNFNELLQFYLNELLENGPGAMQQVKEIVEFATNHPHTDNLQNVQKVFAKTVQSEEARYGMMSFLSKQKPDWSSFVSKL